MANVPFRLMLLIGPGIPVPAPKSVIDALVSVQVTNNTEGASGFQLVFSLASNSPLPTLFLLTGNSPLPIYRVIIMVIVRGLPEVLMDGVVTRTEVAPGEAGQSTLTVTGEDLSKLMDLIPFDGLPYPGMPPETRVMAMIAKYAYVGVVPIVVPTGDFPNPLDQIPRQQGTDLQYTRYLANLVGYDFYVDPGPFPGQSIGYWGPRITLSVPQSALNVNMDAWTNVTAMNFTYDADSAVLPIVIIQPRETSIPIPIPIPNVNPLAPPLGLIPPLPKGIELIDGTKRSPLMAVLLGLAQASKSANVVGATGSLSVARYGRVLRARKLVGVRGGGTAFDGLYYVKSVTHKIKRGEYMQDFTLSRNALVSITPRVVP